MHLTRFTPRHFIAAAGLLLRLLAPLGLGAQTMNTSFPVGGSQTTMTPVPVVMGGSMMPTVMSATFTQTVVVGHKVSFHADAAGSPAMTFQWQISTNRGATWTNLMDDATYNGAASDTLSVMSATMGMSGDQFRMVATNSLGSATGAVFTMNVSSVVLSGPSGLAFDSAGNCWISDGSTNVIEKMTPAGVATMMAGFSGQQGTANGTGTGAMFRQPGGMAIDSAGNVYVADMGNSLIRKISPTGVVTTMAGSTSHQDFRDGMGTDAWFNAPASLMVDPAGNIFVADTGNSMIRKISPSGVVTTVAGAAGMSGMADGVGAAARFNQPSGIAMDSAGMLYVSDTLNQTIRKISPAGLVTTFAGLMGVSGTSDGQGTNALFNQPMGLTFDGAGNLYVADSGNSSIRMVTPAGMVSTLAGLSSISGMMDGMGNSAWFSAPKDVKYDGASSLYVADSGNAGIRKISLQGSVSTVIVTQSPSGIGSSPTTSPGGPTTSAPAAASGGGSGGGAVGVPFLTALFVLSCLRKWTERRRC